MGCRLCHDRWSSQSRHFRAFWDWIGIAPTGRAGNDQIGEDSPARGRSARRVPSHRFLPGQDTGRGVIVGQCSADKTQGVSIMTHRVPGSGGFFL